eukprot:11975-Prorocentrum_minimum.AAC.7
MAFQRRVRASISLAVLTRVVHGAGGEPNVANRIYQGKKVARRGGFGCWCYLMEKDAGVGHGKPPSLGARRQQESLCGSFKNTRRFSVRLGIRAALQADPTVQWCSRGTCFTVDCHVAAV